MIFNRIVYKYLIESYDSNLLHHIAQYQPVDIEGTIDGTPLLQSSVDEFRSCSMCKPSVSSTDF